MPEAVEDEPKTEAKTGRKKLFILVGCAVIALIGSFIGTSAMLKADDPESAETEIAAGEEATSPDSAEDGFVKNDAYSILQMEKMFVNIVSFGTDGTRERRLMGIQLSIVYDAEFDTHYAAKGDEAHDDGYGNDDAAPTGMAAKLPFMRDMFIGYLREVTERDLAGSKGLADVKDELLKRARAVTGDETVREILISDLIIQ